MLEQDGKFIWPAVGTVPHARGEFDGEYLWLCGAEAPRIDPGASRPHGSASTRTSIPFSSASSFLISAGSDFP